MSADVEPAPRNGDLDDLDTPEDLNGGDASDDADLFGDDDEEPAQGDELQRKIDDSELDSGDDEGRSDRIAHTVEYGEGADSQQKPLRLVNIDMARVKPPEGEELYLLNMPPFLGVKHKNFNPATYEAPQKPHDGRDPAVDPTAKFSPFSTAASSIFWRRDPKDPELLQSNSRIIRWSDGSLTLQIASSPKEHYRVSTTALRQGWPKKHGSSQPDYDPNKDTHNYLAAPHAAVGLDAQIIAPFDASMKIQPTGDVADESVLKLQQSLAAATQMHDPLSSFKITTKDPEKRKKEAEQFEKDKLRAFRKVENAQDRILLRKDRVLGRSGLGGRSGGLSIAGLEDDEGMPTARGTKSKARPKRNRRGEIYSDDEDEDYPRGRGREDEYDREDDFLAASDEEPEVYDDEAQEVEAEEEDDPDVDDLAIDGRDTVVENRTRGGIRERDRGSTPKRAAADDEDEDTAPRDSPQARKKRRVIDDDEDDE
ncbi:hypothetical protein H2202_005842 [Exophiala xenobiotica]|nr:hypothetical protein H2202_005842 [Exophiala xenobiotica]KAK5209346.1 hypothetical protein LTR41_004882 [Exophiala xenobiotica]KAK5236559.1 hypothetical protein LTR47_002510 [Exophiala xenobiotica]KAK5247694.1 hypothetical protein LTS06_007193 [Exophiala xenobiotica]KAK5282096.1 hypothetical protein LTR40_003800 [Exophiala xenobiotica]